MFQNVRKSHVNYFKPYLTIQGVMADNINNDNYYYRNYFKCLSVCYRDWKSFVVCQNGARQTGDRCGR